MNQYEEAIEWRDVVGFEGLYRVSNTGIIMGQYGRPLKPSAHNNRRYYRVTLLNKNIKKELAVHRLVADAFIPNPDKKPEVNHKDGDKANNHVSNLEWCTKSENMKHAYKSGLKLLSERSVICLENMQRYANESEAARAFGLNPWDVSSCCRGDRKYTHGYHFMHLDTYDIWFGAFRNPKPLSLDELRERVGKPVWYSSDGDILCGIIFIGDGDEVCFQSVYNGIGIQWVCSWHKGNWYDYEPKEGK